MLIIPRLVFLWIQSEIISFYWTIALKWNIFWAIGSGRIEHSSQLISVHECAKQASRWKISHQDLESKLLETIERRWFLNNENE